MNLKKKKERGQSQKTTYYRFCPGELSITGKSMDTEDRLVVAKSCRKGEMDNDPTRFLLGGD